MRRATTHIKRGGWPAADLVGEVTLDYEDRHRRRRSMTDDAGEAFLLDLPTAVRMADGDGLALEGGGVLAVKAADEAVADLFCADAQATARLAWHIGNRHLALQVLPGGGLRIRDDHVIVAMAEGLGARAERRVAPFAPVTGAYDEGHGHAH